MKTYTKSPEAIARLTPEQYRVTQRDGTERAFTGEYWDNHEPGIYVDVVSGEPLFASVDKFDSGTGWPSFWQALPGAVATKPDHRLAQARVEYHCAHCGGHQGHVFDDGPAPSGQRYCNNGLALRFIPEGEALPPPRSVPPIPPEGA